MGRVGRERTGSVRCRRGLLEVWVSRRGWGGPPGRGCGRESGGSAVRRGRGPSVPSWRSRAGLGDLGHTGGGAALLGEAGSGDAGAAWPPAPRFWRKIGLGQIPNLASMVGQPGRRLGSAASGPWAPRGVGRARRGQTSPGCVGSPWVPFGAFRLCQPPPGALPGAWGGAIGVDPTGQSTFPTSPRHRRWERE